MRGGGAGSVCSVHFRGSCGISYMRDQEMMNQVELLAVRVMQSLGRGHREAVYHRALSTALNHEGICHRTHVDCPIMFMGECVGVGQADLLIDDLVLELKVLQRVPSGASDQLRKYIESLRRTEGRDVRGMVINFNPRSGRVEVVTDRPSEPTREVKRPQTYPTGRSSLSSAQVPSFKKKVVSPFFVSRSRSTHEFSPRTSTKTSPRTSPTTSPMTSPRKGSRTSPRRSPSLSDSSWMGRLTRARSVAF